MLSYYYHPTVDKSKTNKVFFVSVLIFMLPHGGKGGNKTDMQMSFCEDMQILSQRRNINAFYKNRQLTHTHTHHTPTAREPTAHTHTHLLLENRPLTHTPTAYPFLSPSPLA